MKYIKTIAEFQQNDLASAGGKGANLGALIRAGLPVPAGFCITTAGYRRFIEANRLQAHISKQLANIDAAQFDELETTSEAIRRLFDEGMIPEDVGDEIKRVYAGLSSSELGGAAPAVAVRSSATAEDLPDLSFAGQQDTYLNIIGEEDVLRAIVRCWASLWTGRAIGYRSRNHISPDDLSLAVIVQRMVNSEVSGVLFTANPLNGKRCETVIDAIFGLGEALVSGMVEPDHYVVDGSCQKILAKNLGSKSLAIRPIASGGTQTLSETVPNVQALSDAQIIELSCLGARAAQTFACPQDVEWAWANGQFYILQSRPVTSLYPLPENPANPSLEVLFSFCAWQGMLDPITPLGQDMMSGLAVGFKRQFDQSAGFREQRIFQSAGERLFVNITALMHSSLGRKILNLFVDSIDPVSLDIIQNLYQDERLAIVKQRTNPAQGWRIGRLVFPVFRYVLYNLLWPERGRERLARRIDEFIAHTLQQCNQIENLASLAAFVENLPTNIPGVLLPYLLPGIISGQIPLQGLLRLTASMPGANHQVMELTRGLPHNVTTEMDIKLWSVSQKIKADPASAAYFSENKAGELVAAFRDQQLPPVAQQGIECFLQAYGIRGVAEVDLGRPRWKEEPLYILQVLKNYLEINGQDGSPEINFQKGAEKARLAGEYLASAVRHTPLGIFKERVVRAMIRRVRELGGLRETPKFTIVRLMAVLRETLLDMGQKMVASNQLQQKDDLFFLHVWELQQLATGNLPEVHQLIALRRQTHLRELSRKRIPHILLSDGTTFYERISSPIQQTDQLLTGCPVSSGIVEGIVHVIRDPHGSRLAPGEILVCPATDPAWTPLFLSAGGLVMEVGGMMTHGSVVAREYGIPAVVGVHQATTRLKTGQHVRVDGSSGQIQVLE